ncbi:MAG: ABC transporter family substrate-binding protein [Actinomycetota bacterium]|nr:ABC transporter family substrate-binding protein [Actinomycetota bacterium]
MRSFRKRVAIIAPLAVLALSAAACSSGSSDSKKDTKKATTVTVKQGGTLVYAADQEPTGFNNSTSKDNGTSVGNIVETIFPSVFHAQPDFTLKLDTDFMVSAEITKADPETITYKIKPEAKWDDGSDINADDFIYFWEAQNGKAHPDYDVASNTGYEDIQSVTGSDNGKTVTVVFANKFADWKSLFGVGQGLLESKIMKTLPGGWNTGLDKSLPFSGGPFKIGSYKPGDNLTLVRNDKYFGPKSKLDSIVFRFLPESTTQPAALQNGEVQLIYPQPQLDDVAKIKTIPGVSSQINFGLSFEHLDFNFKTPGLDDVAVRKAMATALDRTELLNATVKQFSDKATVLGNRIWLTGQPQYADHSGSFGKGDVAGATSLLEKAGYAKGPDGIYAKGGKPLAFKFSTTAGNKLREQQGVLFQAQMKKAGIQINIDNKPSKVLFPALSKGQFEISDFAWVGTPFSVSSNKAIYSTGGGSNYGKYSNPTVDKKFTDANGELDEKKSAALANEVDQQLWDDMVTIPLYQKPTFIAFKDTFGNIRDNATSEGPFFNAGTWGLKQ